MVNKKKLIRIMDNYNLRKIVLSPQIENSEEKNYKWIHKIFPELDILKLKRKLISLSSSKMNNDNQIHKVYKLQEFVQDQSGRFKIIFNTNIEGSNILEVLEKEYAQLKFSALKVNNFFETINYNSNNFNSILNFCKINSLPIFVYVYRKSEGKHLYKLAKDNPSINFILASISGIEFFEYFSDIPDNLMCELCNLNMVSDIRLLKAINIFGAEKIFFSFETASDNKLNEYIKRITNLSIPESSKDLILSSNIEKIFV